MHNYGLNQSDELGAQIGWRKVPFKRVILKNLEIAKNRITVDKVAKHLENRLIIPEWERKEAYWLVKAIVDALEKGEKTADISQMFSCEFVACDCFGIFALPRKSVQRELMSRLFSKCSENDQVLEVKLNWRVIFF